MISSIRKCRTRSVAYKIFDCQLTVNGILQSMQNQSFGKDIKITFLKQGFTQFFILNLMGFQNFHLTYDLKGWIVKTIGIFTRTSAEDT